MSENILKDLIYLVLDTAQTFVLAFIIFIVLYQVAGQPHIVSGSSMEPNFEDKEFILTQKVSYYLQAPQRGDVVVFHYPLDPQFDYIKRIIAIPGDTAKIQDGDVFINGKRLQEPYLAARTYTSGGAFLPMDKDYTVPANNYLVMGDNRERSSDSRIWGLVPAKNIVGKAFFRYWPPQRIGLITHFAL